jgi:predicted PurR-regulated permease PerM
MLGIEARAGRYTWTAALVLILLCLAYLLRTTVFVFIVAMLFGYLLSPLVNFIDRLLPASRTRTPALAITYVIFIAVLFVGVTQIGSRVIEQANALARSLPAMLASFEQPNDSFPASVNSFKAHIVQKVEDLLTSSSGDIISSLPRAGAKILSVATNLVYLVIVPILGFFFLKDGRKMRQRFLETINDEQRRAMVDDLLADVNLLLAHYMRAILILSLATFTSYSIFFSILRVPFSILLAALAGTLEFIPTIGTVSAAAIIVIVTAVTGGPVLGALAFLVVYRIFQDYVLYPRLMREGVQLDPLFVLFGIFAGAELVGVPGAFLSVPVLALIRIIYWRFRRQRLAAKAGVVSRGVCGHLRPTPNVHGQH